MNELGTVDRGDGALHSQGVSTGTATRTREVDPLSVTKRLQRDGCHCCVCNPRVISSTSCG